MNKRLLSLILVFLGYHGFSQTYISLAPSLTNSAGTIADGCKQRQSDSSYE